jgi:hypothetical protein
MNEQLVLVCFCFAVFLSTTTKDHFITAVNQFNQFNQFNQYSPSLGIRILGRDGWREPGAAWAAAPPPLTAPVLPLPLPLPEPTGSTDEKAGVGPDSARGTTGS